MDYLTGVFSWTPLEAWGPGAYEVTFTVDDSVWTDTETITITVNEVNLPPVAILSPFTSVDEGSEITFDASASYDEDGDEIEYHWDLDGDGVWDVDWSSDPSMSHTYYDDGVFEVSVEVRDLEYTDVETATVTVNDLAPAAEFTWTPEPQDEGFPVAFMDMSTSSPDVISTWSWDFGGLGASIDQNSSFTFMDNGIHTVTLTVTDYDGSIDTISNYITINDLGPTVGFSCSPEPQDEGSPVQFTDASTSNPDAIVAWSWNFDLGSSSEMNSIFTFMEDSVYPVALTVTDDDGSTDTVTHTVAVINMAPSVEAGDDQTAYEGDTVIFHGSFTDPGADTHTVTWDFGDGEADSGTVSPTHVYADNGIYTVTLTVEDDDGGVGSDSITVHAKLIRATIDLDPDTLNLNSGGRYVTCYIELQEGFDPGEIDISTVQANGVAAEARLKSLDDHDGDGVPDLMLKFNREALQGTLEVGDDVTITVTGDLLNDLKFDGSDTIRVIDR